jgi:hypothetical protein
MSAGVTLSLLAAGIQTQPFDRNAELSGLPEPAWALDLGHPPHKLLARGYGKLRAQAHLP